VVSDWLVQSQGPFVAALDPHLTEELRREGAARELVSRIQRLRKDAGYEYTTRIRLAISGGEPVRGALEAHREYVMRETLARELEHGAAGFVPDRVEEFVIDEYAAVIAVAKFTGPAVHN
jgi:isoleucyl-tRNA synthetase